MDCIPLLCICGTSPQTVALTPPIYNCPFCQVLQLMYTVHAARPTPEAAAETSTFFASLGAWLKACCGVGVGAGTAVRAAAADGRALLPVLPAPPWQVLRGHATLPVPALRLHHAGARSAHGCIPTTWRVPAAVTQRLRLYQGLKQQAVG